jgi:phage N-6-adenine-methyltransferase
MAKMDVHFSSEKMDWETPQDFFDKLNEEFHFTLDGAASDYNHKCVKYFTEADNSLIQDWSGETVWLNPPYGRILLPKFVKKAYEEGQKPGTTVVMLIPSRTDTRYFHDYILNKAEIRFLKGRLKFVGAKDAAPFPSMVVIYRA